MKIKKVVVIGCIMLGMQMISLAARNYEKLCLTYEKVCENGKCGLFQNGHHSPIIYNDIQCFGNAILVSTQPGKWHIYNTQTGTASKAQYDKVQPLNMSLLKTKTGNNWGIVTVKGIEFLPAEYEDITVLADNYLIAKNSGKWKIFVIQGQEVKEISSDLYDNIEPASKYYKGYYIITVKGKKGIIYLPTVWQPEKANLSYVKPLFDNIILPPLYNFVRVSQNDQWGFYDLTSGKLATRLYDKISELGSFHKDMLKVSLQGKHGLLMLNKTAKTLEEKLNPSFDDIKALVGKKFVAVAKKGKWGVYDINQQRLVLDPIYDDVRGNGANAVQVLQQNEWIKKQF